jgi:3-deoxy-D-manno-octulosonic-acid transferase
VHPFYLRNSAEKCGWAPGASINRPLRYPALFAYGWPFPAGLACLLLLPALPSPRPALAIRHGGHTSRGGVCLEWLDLISSFYSVLYSVALALAMLAMLPYWLFQMARHGKYRQGLVERLGRVPSRLQLPAEGEPVIWVHAVSVGEVLAVAGLVEELQRRFPQHRIFISTTTDAGQALARKRFGETNVFYFPLDFAFAIRPYLRALRPKMVVIAETEFWPNFMRLAHASGARIAVVNARISDRSWPSYRRFRGLLRRPLGHVNVFLAQTDEDAGRLEAIGALPERVRVAGNLKFDVPAPAPPAIVDRLRNSIAASLAGPVLVCGSTVEGEEPLLLKAFENLAIEHRRAVMILAPRHPERFPAVAELLGQMSIRFCRRSRWNGEALAGGVLLLDTIGELAALYALADVAFVGGSLVPRGGHNLIEPAQHGVAVVVGNHTENFRDVVSLFQSRDAVRVVGPRELPRMLLELLANDTERIALGRRAAETMRSQSGATARTAEELQKLLARP